MGKWTLPPAAALALLLATGLIACTRRPPSTAPAGADAEVAAPQPAPAIRSSEPVRAAYFYGYMSTSHLDSLAAAGFNRALIKSVGDSLGARGTREMQSWSERGARLGVEVVPTWSLQSRARLASLATARRYTPGDGTLEPDVGCPLDPAFWRSALLDRAGELFDAMPRARRLVLDLEIYTGGPHHYDAPCACAACRRDHRAYAATIGPGEVAPGLAEFEEARLERILAGLLAEFAGSHPGVELGVFDLDFDSFVHRAMARALARAGVPTTDYSERSYSTAGGVIPAVRAELESLGVVAPVVGGIKLGMFMPEILPEAIRSVTSRAEGYFVFTTYSLWVDPTRRVGAYALRGTPARYWAALAAANR